MPGIIIAGTNSGCGKTTITNGILASLVKRGLKVQPFKAGPDYIDPMFHSFITGNYSRNLDSWMLDEETIRYLYSVHALKADITVVEGVMGIYDGFGRYNEGGSTAHIARIIGLPVILVVNAEGLSLSAAALVKGFIDFDRDVNIKGIILNNIYSEDHYKLLKCFVEEYTGIKVLGYLEKEERYNLDSRHLGLKTPAEIGHLKIKIDKLSEQIEKTIDIECLLNIAREDSAVQLHDLITKSPFPAITDLSENNKVRIAVAMDQAFCFYYRDNLELLERLGAELIYFSLINGSSLPENIDGLYIGGGYPEVWAEELENNVAMRQEIKRKILKGLPAYTECGGLMYMSEAIKDMDGRIYKMAGLIPGICEMTSSLKRFGYVEIEISCDNILSSKDQKIRGHEFHFSDIVIDLKAETCYKVMQKKIDGSLVTWPCGYKIKNLLAGYAHLHFWSNPEFAIQFINTCRQWQERTRS